MRDKYISKEDKLRHLMYAMTLNEREDPKGLWSGGKAFHRMHQRGDDALYNYWKNRLDTEPEVEKMLEAEWLKFLDYVDNHHVYGYPKREAQLAARNKNKEKYTKKFDATSPEGAIQESQDFQPPSLMDKAKSLASAAKNLAKSGFKFADKELYETRLAICKTCDRWDPEAFGGTGKCLLCGCATQAKLRFPLENCPIGKWKAVNAQGHQSSSSETPGDQSTQVSQ